ncbi:3682_t:CDS:2, partial [Acaulospora morrowiae]
FIVFQFGVKLAVSIYIGDKYAIFKYNYITMALIISSFGKILLILMVIWDYNELEYSWLINIVVLTSNLEALAVLLDIDYLKAFGIMVFGLGLKVLAQ